MKSSPPWARSLSLSSFSDSHILPSAQYYKLERERQTQRPRIKIKVTHFTNPFPLTSSSSQCTFSQKEKALGPDIIASDVWKQREGDHQREILRGTKASSSITQLMILSLIQTHLYGKGQIIFYLHQCPKYICLFVLEKSGHLLKLNILDILVKSPGPASTVAKACQAQSLPAKNPVGRKSQFSTALTV